MVELTYDICKYGHKKNDSINKKEKKNATYNKIKNDGNDNNNDSNIDNNYENNSGDIMPIILITVIRIMMVLKTVKVVVI